MKNLLKMLVGFALVAVVFQIVNPTSGTIEIESQATIETKFSTIQLTQFEYALNEPVVITAYQNKIAVAKRKSSKIDIFSQKGNHLKLISTIELKDILIIEKSSEIFILDLESTRSGRIYVSYLDFYDDARKCDHVKVIEFEKATSRPRLIFTSTPCLSMLNKASEAGGYIMSGRLAVSDTHVYIAGGMSMIDLASNTYPNPNVVGMSGNFKRDLAMSNLYGSVSKIDIRSLHIVKVSTGHRSPQGLAYDPVGDVLWLSEHGPSGGDELNKIKQGGNYGWPYVSLGQPYDNAHLLMPYNTFDTQYSSHSGFIAPVLSWSPSIAPSQLVVVPKKSGFDRSWQGNILLSTLKDMSIHRLVLSKTNDVVLDDERIQLGHRIRDIALTESRIWASTDGGKILLLSPG